MTELRPGSSVTRRTQTMIRDGGKARPLVVTIHTEFIELRLLGTRRAAETVMLEHVYHAAVKGRVFRAKMEKAKERKQLKEMRKGRR